jgi:hypothetical protein
METIANTMLDHVRFSEMMYRGLVESLSGRWQKNLVLPVSSPWRLLAFCRMSPVSIWTTGTLPGCRTTYLPSLIQVTAMNISDDSGFLDCDCGDIFHCEFNLKLNSYLGRTSEFVLKRPERGQGLLRAPDVNMVVMVTSV